MDFWIIIKERYMLLLVLLIIAAASIVLLLAVWKNRSGIKKSLLGAVTVLSVLILALTMAAMLFTISFGYNS